MTFDIKAFLEQAATPQGFDNDKAAPEISPIFEKILNSKVTPLVVNINAQLKKIGFSRYFVLLRAHPSHDHNLAFISRALLSTLRHHAQ